MVKRRQVVNWLHLPTHVMELISDKLMIHINDYIRFGAVCHSWHSIFTQNSNHLPRQHPVLLLVNELTEQEQDQDQDQDRRLFQHSFYDFIEKRIYKFQLKLPSHYDIRGSNHGWLIYEKDSRLTLLNPFSPAANVIILPPILEFILLRYEKIEYFEFGSGDSFIYKAMLWGNPASSSNYVVVASDIHYSMLALYKSGDKKWTHVITDEFQSIDDFICYKDQLYMLSKSGLYTCDVRSSHPKLSKVAPPIVAVYAYDLVESSGELLAVNNANFNFKGYILDQNLFDWVEIKSLSGWSLFMSIDFSLSRLCSNYPGWKPNSVYSTIEKSDTEQNKDAVVNVQNLEDGSIESLYLTESNPFVYSTAKWIEPALLGRTN